MLSQSQLKKILRYEASTGKFYWRLPPRGSKEGDEAGMANKPKGYVVIYIEGKQYYAHRLAWLYVKGSWPSKCVDHINECRTDNRIENLRDVSSGKNLHNRSKEGIGVHFRKDRNTWLAHICINGKPINLGSYSTREEAVAARYGAKQVYNYLEVKL